MEPKTAADLHGNASVRWIGLIILLGAALVLASQSFGVYVRTDDLDWLQRWFSRWASVAEVKPRAMLRWSSSFSTTSP